MAKRISMKSQADVWGPGLTKEFSASLDDLLRSTEEEKQRDTDFEAVMHTTTSSSPERPRTLSAGYDSRTEKLTVVFRDGTWWEYRGVPQEMWQEFKSAPSKGVYLRESGLDTWDDMGPADIRNMPVHRRAQINYGTGVLSSMYNAIKLNKD